MYERLGGPGPADDFFRGLIDRFYLGVAGDPLLRPLYPEDLSEPNEHLRLFLVQYWGGPPAYGEQRGHPRLRMRHAPFVITITERDAWLRHMRDAIEGSGASPEDAAELLAYFEMAANTLVNAR